MASLKPRVTSVAPVRTAVSRVGGVRSGPWPLLVMSLSSPTRIWPWPWNCDPAPAALPYSFQHRRDDTRPLVGKLRESVLAAVDFSAPCRLP